MSHFIQDLRFARRSLSRQPGWTLTVILTLALGIGTVTAIFSVVDAVLLRPLPFPDPERLVMVWESNLGKGWEQYRVSPPAFAEWRRDNEVFEGLAAVARNGFVVRLDDEPRAVHGLQVSPGFFRILGVAAAAGRTFLPGEEEPGQDGVVVVRHDFAQRVFASAANAVGRDLVLDDETFTVVGVLPPGFELYEPAELFVPLGFPPQALGPGTRGARYLRVIGRLKEAVSLAGASTAMASLAERAAREDGVEGWSVTLVPFHEQLVGESRPVLVLLLAAVVFVLLIACANVANLLLARSVSRQREMAIRGALGAGRQRLVDQLLTESMVLALAGGGLGALFAMWSVDVLVRWMPSSIPRLHEVAVDPRALGFTAVLTLAVGVLAGLVPAFSTARVELVGSLRESGLAAAGSPFRLRRLLVVAETAISLVLLVCAGLMLRSFVQLRAVDPGFRPDAATISLFLPASRYAEAERKAAFERELLGRLRALPGVESAALGTNLPLSGSNMTFGFSLPGEPEFPAGDRPTAEYHATSPHYFRTLGIPLRRGRSFSPDDGGDAPPVALVNAAFGRRFFPGRDPVGRRLATAYDGVEREIVGVVGDVRHFGLDSGTQPEVYVPYAQNPWPFFTVVLRAAAGTTVSAAAWRDAVWEIDPSLPVEAIGSQEGQVAALLSPMRVQMVLLGLFGSAALLLTMLGLYGVISYSFRQRTREIGIRVALGALRRDILRHFLAQGLRLTLVGTAIGLLGSLAVTRLLSGFLYGVGPRDPMTFVGTAALVAAVGIVACWHPAERAASVDPVVALRTE